MVNVNFSIYHLEFFLLIFVRVAGIVYLAPVLGSKNIPIRVKIGESFFLSIIVAMITPYTPLSYTTIIGYTLLIAKEFVTGIVIGFFANVCMTIVIFTGQLIDRDIGFTMVSMFDPTTSMETTITGSFYNYMVLLIILLSDLYYFIINAVVDSFKIVPVTGAKYNPDYMYEVILKFMRDYFIIGFRIVLPIFASVLLLNVVLGILAKAAPQMNMFVIGMQLKIMLGLGVLVLTIGFLPNITDSIFSEVKTLVSMVLKGMT